MFSDIPIKILQSCLPRHALLLLHIILFLAELACGHFQLLSIQSVDQGFGLLEKLLVELLKCLSLCFVRELFWLPALIRLHTTDHNNLR